MCSQHIEKLRDNNRRLSWKWSARRTLRQIHRDGMRDGFQTDNHAIARRSGAMRTCLAKDGGP